MNINIFVLSHTFSWNLTILIIYGSIICQCYKFGTSFFYLRVLNDPLTVYVLSIHRFFSPLHISQKVILLLIKYSSISSCSFELIWSERSDFLISILQFLQNFILSSDIKYVSPISCVEICMKFSNSAVRLASNCDFLFESLHNISNVSFVSFVAECDCQKTNVFLIFKL